MIVDSDNKDNNVMTRIVDLVLEAMPDDFVIKEIITNHKAEVTDMLYTIEDEPRMMAIHEEALRNEGYEKARKEDLDAAIELLMEEGRSKEEAIRKVEKKYNTTIERKQEQNKEARNAPYSIEDESRMMNIHEEAIRNEGYEKAQKECLNTFIEILIKEGHSEEEARRMVEEEFKENK